MPFLMLTFSGCLFLTTPSETSGGNSPPGVWDSGLPAVASCKDEVAAGIVSSCQILFDDADAIIFGDATTTNFATEVALVGDLDSNGIPDLIGATAYPGGVAFVFGGPLTGEVGVDTAIANFSSATTGWGGAVEPADDTDGDGFHGIWIDDQATTESRRYEGPFLGDAAGLTADATLEGIAGVLLVDDLNGDGVEDVLGSLGSHVYLIPGPHAVGGQLDDYTLDVWNHECDAWGGGVANLGDWDGDGFSEVYIGSVGAFACFGDAQGVVVSTATSGLIDVAAGDAVVATIVAGGAGAVTSSDVNADGILDFITGVPGAVGVLYGPFAGEVDARIDADLVVVPQEEAAAPVPMALGDLDANGHDELFALFPHIGGGDGWEAWVVEIEDVTDIERTTSEFPFSVASDIDGGVGTTAWGSSDLDSDGFRDIVIGMPKATWNGVPGAGVIGVFSGARY